MAKKCVTYFVNDPLPSMVDNTILCVMKIDKVETATPSDKLMQ